jgi:hypothetical protein
MASEAQVLANRSNAQKSTGPRTPEGKATVSQNAVKHGLLAAQAVIKGEDPGEFEFYRDQMLGELAPVGQMESVLAERVVSLSWRLQRAERLQSAAFDAMYAQDTAGPLAGINRMLRAKGNPGDGSLVLGQVVVADFAHAKVLDRLLMYEWRIEHSLYRTMTELQKHRLMRELDPPTEGSTGEAVSAGSTSILPVNLDHGRDAHATESPYGGATNGADAEEPSCETKPISAGVSEGQVPCGTEVRSDPSPDGLRETNPILWGQAIAAGTILRTMKAVVGAYVDP